MASIEIGPLSQHLDEDEIAVVEQAFEEADIELELDEEADSRVVEGGVDEDLMADFLDQLDANDAACDLYMPMDFEEMVEAGEYRIGSAHALMLVLEEIRDDIFEGEDDDDEAGEEYSEFEDADDEHPFGGGGGEAVDHLKEEQLRLLWKAMLKAARTSIREGTCLYVHR